MFPTPSGKIELVSSVLKDLNFDPLPKFTAVEQPPPGYMRLIYGRAPMHSFSRSENNSWLDDLMPENQVWINAEFAAKAGIKNRQVVILENQDGTKSLPISVRETEGIRNDCAYMVHGFGTRAEDHEAYKRGASDTDLITRVSIDPIMGATGMRVNFVRVLPTTGERGWRVRVTRW